MTTLGDKGAHEQRSDLQGSVPTRSVPLMVFMSGVLALLLVAGWLSRLA